jgi:hypothetical protein
VFDTQVRKIPGFALVGFLAAAAWAAPPDSPSIDPARAALVVRSYQRCVAAGPDGKRVAGEAKLFAASYPFDVDALSLLTVADIDRAPRESSDGIAYIRCEWFGRAAQGRGR